MNTKFKVGDKVRVVSETYEDGSPHQCQSRVGLVANIKRIDYYIYPVELDLPPCGGFEAMFRYEDLELVEEEPTREELEKQLEEIKAKLDKIPKKYVVEGYTHRIFTPNIQSRSWSDNLGLDGICEAPTSSCNIKVRITIEEIK